MAARARHSGLIIEVKGGFSFVAQVSVDSKLQMHIGGLYGIIKSTRTS